MRMILLSYNVLIKLLFRISLFSGLICLILAGCGQDIETGIIGEWEGITPKQDLVFHEDGRVEMKGHQHGVYTGQYTITDGKDLKCEFPRLSKPVECVAQIRGNKLKLVFPGGREERYTRK